MNRTITIAALVILLSACADPVKEGDRTGYISDYSRLQQLDEKTYVFVSPKVSGSVSSSRVTAGLALGRRIAVMIK